MNKAREVSFKILQEVLYRNKYSNVTIERYTEHMEDYRDINLIREIVYGVLENNLYLEYMIGKISKVRLDRIHDNIFIILKIGIYQLIFLDGIVDRAAVYETVELARQFGNKGSIGYVNGMLRNVIRNKDDVKEIETKDPVEYISIKYSHPRWLVERWIEEFGMEFTRELCRANNRVADFTIRNNNLRISSEELKGLLEEKGYGISRSNYTEDSLIVQNPQNMIKSEEYKEGLFTIQGTSSTLVGKILNPEVGARVLDVCAAPGGKSTHLGEIMENKGEILSRDVYPHKLGSIKEDARRLGIDIIKVSGHDGRKLDESLIDQMDYCLVDAPCSGFGTINKNPEIKIFRKKEDVASLAEIQYDILNITKNYVKKDGILLYSTCTIGREENDDIIEKFLSENEEFELAKLEDEEISTEEGYIKLYPHKHGSDGFFMAKMIRRS